MTESEWRHFEHVLLFVLGAVNDFLDLFSDCDHGVDESVHFVDVLRFCGLDHESTDNWPGHSWRVETVVHESLGNVFFSDSVFFEFVAIEDELVSHSSLFSSEFNLVCTVKLVSHVVGVQNGLLSGLQEARSSHHLDESVGNWNNTGITVWSSSDSTALSAFDWYLSVTWDEWLKMLLVTNGSDSWSTTSVRNRESLMKIQVAYVSTDQTWGGKTKLSVHVRTIHVNLTTIPVDRVAAILDRAFEYTMGRWVSNHDTGEFFGELLGLLFDLVSPDVSVLITVNWNDFHTAKLSSGWVGSVGGSWHQADVSMMVTSAFVVLLDGHETGVLSSGSTMWLGRNGIVLGDGDEVVFNLLNHGHVTLSLVHWRKWMHVGETVPSDWDHTNGRVELHGAGTERDHGVCKTDILLAESLDISHHIGFRELHLENVLLQEWSCSPQFVDRSIIGSVLVHLEWHAFLSRDLSLLDVDEDLNELIEVVQTGEFIERYRDGVAVDLSNVDAIFVELGNDVIRRGQA